KSKSSYSFRSILSHCWGASLLSATAHYNSVNLREYDPGIVCCAISNCALICPGPSIKGCCQKTDGWVFCSNQSCQGLCIFSISVPVYQIISYARVHSHFSRVNGNLVSCVRASTSCFRGIWRYSNSPNSHHCSRYASNNCVLDFLIHCCLLELL